MKGSSSSIDLSSRSLELLTALYRHDIAWSITSETNSDKSLVGKSPRVRGERTKQSNPGMDRRASKKRATVSPFRVSLTKNNSLGEEQAKAVMKGLRAFWSDRQISIKSLTWAGFTELTSRDDSSKKALLPTYQISYNFEQTKVVRTSKVIVIFRQQLWNNTIFQLLQAEYGRVTFVNGYLSINGDIVITNLISR